MLLKLSFHPKESSSSSFRLHKWMNKVIGKFSLSKVVHSCDQTSSPFLGWKWHSMICVMTWMGKGCPSSVFNIINHAILLGHLPKGQFLVPLFPWWDGSVLMEEESSWTLIRGVPQGSVFFPLLHNTYIMPLRGIIQVWGINNMQKKKNKK